MPYLLKQKWMLQASAVTGFNAVKGSCNCSNNSRRCNAFQLQKQLSKVYPCTRHAVPSAVTWDQQVHDNCSCTCASWQPSPTQLSQTTRLTALRHCAPPVIGAGLGFLGLHHQLGGQPWGIGVVADTAVACCRLRRVESVLSLSCAVEARPEGHGGHSLTHSHTSGTPATPHRDLVVQGVDPAAHSTSHGGPPGMMAQQHAAVAATLPDAVLVHR